MLAWSDARRAGYTLGLLPKQPVIFPKVTRNSSLRMARTFLPSLPRVRMTPSVPPGLDAFTTSDSNGGSTINTDDSQDLELLDKQAEAHFMNAQFTLAFKDTERILELAPASAIGYLRMGDLYSRQGRQRAAISVYRRGLECVSRHDPRRAELEKRRKLASERKRKRVDFFHVLTDDIIFDILTYLTLHSRSICAEVSTVWRARIVSYSELWRVLSYPGNARSTKVYTVIPYIASHIEELNMPIKCYDDMSACSKHFGYMKAGLFENLESLTVSDVLASHFQCQHVIPALSQLRGTLRRLSVTVNGVSDPDTVTTVAAILSSCPDLTDLTYYMRYPMHTCAGDFSKLDVKHPLIALSLQPALVDGYNLEPLLQKCPSIRRLVIKRAYPTTLGPVLRLCPELKIFGYNTRSAPELSEEERETKPAGLRSLRMPVFTRPFDYASVFPLLYKNKETLEDLQANWTINTGRIKWGLFRFWHTNFRFRKLRMLNVWFDRNTDDIQLLFWRAVRECATLTDIDVKGALLCPFVNMAIGLPGLKSLCVEKGKGTSLQGCYSDLERLFNASLECFLEQVQLLDTNAVTDGTLTALAGVSTLKEVTLINCITVTEKGLGRFFQALNKHENLAYLELAFMDCAEDHTIRILATIPNLRVIKLKRLLNITDSGVLDMAKLVLAYKSPLERLEIRGCPGISQARFDKVNNNILAHATCTLVNSA